MTYSVRVELQDYQGRDQEPLEYILDLGFRYGLEQVTVKTVHDIAKSIEKIAKNTGKWTQHADGVRVWVRNEDERIRLEREQLQAERARRSRHGNEPPEGEDGGNA